MIALPQDGPHFIEGALYSRRDDIHAHFGGQRQGGISTPASWPYVFLFSGSSGHSHGYFDFVDDDLRLHYFGEGQSGDMTWKGGNKAILTHRDRGARLFVFKTLGHGLPVRYFGEYRYIDHYIESGVPDTGGAQRKAIVFVLESISDHPEDLHLGVASPVAPNRDPTAVTKKVLTTIRTGQQLFRRRLELVEKACRLTGVRDSRSLRASHIKPWSACDSDKERIDGNNGLLLTPNVDHLFDRGYISFRDSGRLIVASNTPETMLDKLCPQARTGKRYGDFRPEQQRYLEYHRDVVFNKWGF